MRHLGLKVSLVATTLAALAGCGGCNHPPPATIAVVITQPTDGQNFNSTQLPITVIAQATSSSGAPVTITQATLQTGPALGNFTKTINGGTFNGGTITFTGVALPDPTNFLQVSINNGAAISQTVSVTAGALTQSVKITSPSDNTALNASNNAADGGSAYQIAFTVTTTGFDAGAQGLLYCPNVCGIPTTPFTVGANGTATFDVTLSEGICELTSASCIASVQSVPSPAVDFTLDTVPPEIAIASPVGPVQSRTFTVTAVVTCAEDGSTATLKPPAGSTLSATVTGGVVSFANVTVPADGSFTYQLTVTDKGGNTTTVPVPVVVDSVSPTVGLAVTGASAQGVITQDADNNPANGVQADVVITANTEPVGTEVDLWTTVTGTLAYPRRLATATVGANKQATFRVDLAEGSDTLKACVTSVSGITGCSPVQVVTVSTGRSLCRILNPADNEYRDAAGNPVTVSVEAATGAITLNAVDSTGAVRATVTGSSTGGVTVLPPLTLPADGAYHLIADCAGNGVSQSLPLLLDTSAITVTACVEGDTTCQGKLGSNIIDTSPLPGLQVILDVTLSPVLKAYSKVVVTGCGMTSGVAGTADGTGKVTIRDVTVPQTGPGCSLTVAVTDLSGNTKSSVFPITPEFSNGSLSLIDPAPGSILTGAPDGGTGSGLTAPLTFNFTPQTGGGTLALTVNGAAAGSTPVSSTDISKTFANVQLAEGTNVIRAVLTDVSQNATCAVGVLYVNTTGPGSIVITQPGSGKLNIASDLAPGTPGIQYPLQYTASPKSTNFSVDICVSQVVPGEAPCKDGSGYFTLASNVPSYTALFTFPDGVYSMTAVLDDNSTIKTSPVVSLTVDSIRPKVLSVSIPADTNGDGILSFNELKALNGSPVTVVATPSGLDANGTANITDANTGFLYGQSGPYSGTGTISIPLTFLPANPEVSYNFVINLTRTSGNPNKVSNPQPLDPLNDAAFVTVAEDDNVPLVTVTSPTKTLIGLADLLPGNKIHVAALIPDSDIPNNGVVITPPSTVTPGTPVSLTNTGGSVSQDFAINTVSGVQQFAFAIVATDNAGNVGDAGISISACLSNPAVTITSPTANSTVTTHSITITATVATGCSLPSTVQVSDSLNGGAFVPVGTLPLSGGTATGTIGGFADGVHSIMVAVADVTGNPGSMTVTPVTVAAPGCTVQFTHPAPIGNPVYLGQSFNQNAGPPLSLVVNGTSPDCHGLTVQLCQGGSCPGTGVLGSTTADVVTGNFTFPAVTEPDNSTGSLTLAMNNGVATSTTLNYSIKLTPPVLSSVSPSQSPLYYVASSNINLFTLPSTPGYIADLAGGPPYNSFATANFSFQVANAVGGQATLTYGGSVLASTAITTDPQVVTFNGLQLPQKSAPPAKSLVFGATDIANNPANVTSSVAAVDVIPPAPVTLDAGIAPDGGRLAIVDLNWTASGDDWLTGTPTGYDVRWSTSLVVPGGIPDDATYFDLTTPKVQQAGGGLQPPSQTSYVLSGVPPLNTYWIGTRAVDAVGNYSPFEPSTQSTYPPTIDQVDNLWNSLTVTNPDGTGSPFFGFVVHANGDLNGDGTDDLAVGSQTDGFGTVFVYYGGAGTPFGTHQAFTPANATAAEGYGRDLTIANVGDDPGTPATVGRPDLLVGSKGFSANRGRAFLYFGKTAAQIDNTTFIEFRGRLATGGRFGFNVHTVKDFHGGTYDDVLISAPTEGTTGTVYLFKGRDLSAWQALATSTDTGLTGSYIPVTSADVVFTGDTNVQWLGGLHGYASVADITGDGFPELTIPASVICTEKLFLFGSGTVQGAVGSGTPLAPSSALQTMSQTPQPGCGSSQPNYGFGQEALSSLNLLGSLTTPDLVVSLPYNYGVYLYPDATSTGFTNAPQIIQSTGNYFGFGLASADLNQDGRPDLIIGENPPGGNGSSAWLFFNKKASGAEFDLAPGNSFNQSKLSSGFSRGISVTTGDFNGDGLPDLAVSDPVNNTFTVWY